MSCYRKSSPAAPSRYFAWEAAGLRWLAGALDGSRNEALAGVPVVEVLDLGPTHLELVRLESVPPVRGAAVRFGTLLARTHRSGAAAYGSGPPGWVGDGFFGPLSHPLPLSLRPCTSWAEHLADNLLGPVTRACRDAAAVDAAGARMLDEVASRADRFDTAEPPARIHGDLWSGNLIWTPGGATLIDPAAHGGHREADLAMLALFGAPYLQDCLAAYQAEWPLAQGWRERTGRQVPIVQLSDPAVLAPAQGHGDPGDSVTVTVRGADVAAGQVDLVIRDSRSGSAHQSRQAHQ